MTVIKQGIAGRWSGGSARASQAAELMRELKSDVDTADDVIAKARQQADIMVRTARSEANALREKARQDGYEQGLAESTAITQSLIDRLEADLAELGRERAALLESAEEDALKLCVEAVEKVIRHEIRTDPRVVLRTIKSCMRRVTEGGGISVRVSPEEMEAVKAARDELVAVSDTANGITITEDRRVSPGGCVVETPAGEFDARIETQVDQIRRKLLETRNDGLESDPEPEEIQDNGQPA